MRLIPLFLAALLVTNSALASSLDGFIRSLEGGESVAFARVSLLAVPSAGAAADSAGGAVALPLPARTLTNAAGYYALLGIPPGDYRLQVRAVGYREREQLVTIGVEPRRLDVALETAPFQVPTVTVTGDSTRVREQELQSGFSEISAKQLARIPAVGEQDIIR
ncbi:MAG TPA: carboxypeptidase-like regulatory domain-containing protein, partial [Candidatus Eisenbacteria bacterium]|nr:carboxypeptidase-like regulatory domain-containing protein [Candidatus Eisenbacteria bacterium]